MKKILIPTLLVGLFISSCKKDDKPDSKPTQPEAAYLRLVVSDVDKAQITVLEPLTKKTTVFPIKAAQPTLYATSTGQFATVISKAANTVEFLNSGIEKHAGHLHVHLTEMAKQRFTEAGPTHYYAYEGLNAIFNDGTGSISIFKDNELEDGSGRVLPVAQPHHGAMVIYDDHTLAVTQKDGTVSGTLPEKVKIIDRYGVTLHEGTIATKGIHGDAGNGKLAAFGSPDGILIVQQNGTQSLITYPTDFGTSWIGTVLGNKALPHFFGYVALGLYKIDPVAKKISLVLKNENSNIHQYMLDTDGKNLYVLLTDGTLKIFDAVTAQLKKEGKITAAFTAGAPVTEKPYFAVSRKCVYVTDQAAAAVKMLSLNDLKEISSIPVGSKPFKLLVVGDQEDLEVIND
jgi:DNA-binding beta-propeller fold protein YncE